MRPLQGPQQPGKASFAGSSGEGRGKGRDEGQGLTPPLCGSDKLGHQAASGLQAIVWWCLLCSLSQSKWNKTFGPFSMERLKGQNRCFKLYSWFKNSFQSLKFLNCPPLMLGPPSFSDSPSICPKPKFDISCYVLGDSDWIKWTIHTNSFKVQVSF